MPKRHPLHRFPGAQDCSGNVGDQDFGQACGVQGFHPRKTAGHTSVVDESTDRPKISLGFRKQTDDVSFQSNITANGYSGIPRRANVLNDIPGSCFVIEKTQSDGITPASRQPSDCSSDATASSSDDKSTATFIPHNASMPLLKRAIPAL